MTTVDPQKALEDLIIPQLFSAVNHEGWDLERYRFVGTVINLLLAGVTLTMFLKYLTHHSHPRLETSALSFATALVSWTTCLSVKRSYHMIVLNFARPDVMLMQGTMWDIFVDPMVAGFVAAGASVMYARRLFIFTGGRLWVKILAYSAIAFKYIITIVNVIWLSRTPRINASFFDPDIREKVEVQMKYMRDWKPWILADAGLYVPIELALCVGTIWQIEKDRRNSRFPRTSSFLKHIILISIRSLVLPVIGYLVAFFLILMNDDAKKYSCISNYLDKLVLISVLALLLDRDQTKQDWKRQTTTGVQVHVDSIASNPMPITSIDRALASIAREPGKPEGWTGVETSDRSEIPMRTLSRMEYRL